MISDSQLAFMLRDDLVDFIIENKCDVVYVGTHSDVFDMVFESGIMNRQLENAWANKQIYFYADDSIAREKWQISKDKPEGLKSYVRVLAKLLPSKPTSQSSIRFCPCVPYPYVI